MILVRGVYVPDVHFEEHVRNHNPLYRRKGTYRWEKLRRALETCGAARRGHAIDVGAHCGLWTRVLSHEFKFVTAFEPMDDYREMIALNCRGRTNVRIEPVGLGRAQHLARFTRAGPGEGTSHVSASTGDRSAEIWRLDSFEDILPVSFLKISCEGAEHNVLLGAHRILFRDKPVILIEQRRKRMGRYGFEPQASVSMLKDWGWQVAWEQESDWCLIPKA